MNPTMDDCLLREGQAPRLGAVQIDRLRKVTGRCRSIVLWDGVSAVPDVSAAVVVLEAVHAARVETLISSLDENSIVILPYGEHPAFDTLKSRLHAYGSLGADGATAPHHVWWGGMKPPATPTGIYRKDDVLFVSSYDDSDDADHVVHLVQDFRRLGLDHVVIPTPRSGHLSQTGSKVDAIVQQWNEACRPIFWIDPRARLTGVPFLPQAIQCDFAAHRRHDGTMPTGALFFHQTEHAHALLDIWQRLTCSHANLPASFLLDQAWTMTCSQRQIETAWLPDNYWRTYDDVTRGDSVIVTRDGTDSDEHPLAPYAAPLQIGRRHGRHQSPEAHLVMKGTTAGHGLITVVIRDVLAAGASEVGGAIEAAASAFANDDGGFSQMEIVLCGWDEDVSAVLDIEDHAWVLVTDASERLCPDSFRLLALDRRKAGIAQFGDARHLNANTSRVTVLSLVDPELGARMKRSGIGQSFFRRSGQPSAPVA